MKLQFILILLAFALTSCNKSSKKKENSPSGWQAVYKHDENGQPLEGHIDSLIAGIRNGYDVRIGWGWQKELGDSIMRLEHMAEPLFLIVVQEKNVSAIIDPHPMLMSYLEMENQKFSEGAPEWQCVLNTNGNFNAQVHSRKTGELLRDWPQKQRMTWFLEYPVHRSKQRKSLFH